MILDRVVCQALTASLTSLESVLAIGCGTSLLQWPHPPAGCTSLMYGSLRMCFEAAQALGLQTLTSPYATVGQTESGVGNRFHHLMGKVSFQSVRCLIPAVLPSSPLLPVSCPLSIWTRSVDWCPQSFVEQIPCTLLTGPSCPMSFLAIFLISLSSHSKVIMIIVNPC